MDDQKIIALYIARNDEANVHTASFYGKRLFTLAGHILKSSQDAEENVNDTYWSVWNSIPPQRPNHFFAFLSFRFIRTHENGNQPNSFYRITFFCAPAIQAARLSNTISARSSMLSLDANAT